MNNNDNCHLFMYISAQGSLAGLLEQPAISLNPHGFIQVNIKDLSRSYTLVYLLVISQVK